MEILKYAVLLIGLFPYYGAPQPQNNSDYNALMAFKVSADSSNNLSSWNGKDPCTARWFGVRCRNNKVIHLVLENFGLTGPIDALADLDQLRVLSLKNNFLNGTMPNLTKWRSIKLLFLSYNNFSGPLPSSISLLDRIWRLDVSNNNFSGQIPFSSNSLTHLLTLRLENNVFTGTIAQLNITSLQDFNVSGNHLTGAIPGSLSKFPATAFANNLVLCGNPLPSCKSIISNPTTPGGIVNSNPVTQDPTVVPSTPSSKPTMGQNTKNGSNRLSRGAVIAIVVGDFAVLLLIAGIFVCYYWRKYAKRTVERKPSKRLETEKIVYSSSPYQHSSTSAERGKLVFFEGTRQFELEDLLRASAEMLGKGSFGTAYKAVLDDGNVVAVKRLKDAQGSGKRDFDQHMELVGRLRHVNLVSLKAYYYARDEKLLVYDYMANGSLFSLLHGNRGPGRTPLDWTTRMQIAVGAARGLAFIHHSCKSPKLAHGNIKSSNILLDKSGNACISDFGLAVLISPASAASRSAGYRAPEQAETRKISQKADVYSFGVLLLEILTGKAPFQPQSPDEGIDLPKWVQSVVREEWTAEVFDLELMRYKDIEEELVGMLQIAMLCVSSSPEQRPKMSYVVKMIEQIRGEQSPMHESFDSLSQSPSISEDTGTTSH